VLTAFFPGSKFFRHKTRIRIKERDGEVVPQRVAGEIRQLHIVPRSLLRVTSESGTRIAAVTHNATAFRLDYDSIRLENRAFVLAVEVHRQTFFL
jgi:hypothetical protein